MRISFELPERFADISVGSEQWCGVEHAAREAIEWVDKNESVLEGWFPGTYSFFICSLIQVRLAPLRGFTDIELILTCFLTTSTMAISVVEMLERWTLFGLRVIL